MQAEGLSSQSTIIIDVGSLSIKAGLFNIEQHEQMEPCVNVPNVMGSIRKTCPTQVLCMISPIEDFVGDQAWQKSGMLDLKYPVHRGKVIDWPALDKVLHHVCFNQLREDPAEHNMIILQSHHSQQQHEDEHKLLQIIFEKLVVPKLCIIDQFTSVLMYYYHCHHQVHHNQNSNNLTTNNNIVDSPLLLTGVVVNSGHTHTVIVPIVEGKVVHHAVIELQLGGMHIEQYFCDMFKDRYTFSNNNYDKMIARHIKQSLFYVALDPEHQCQQFKNPINKKSKQYIFGSSYMMQMREEIFESCEIFFNPGLLKQQQSKYANCGIPEAIINSILNVAPQYHEALFRNIVLSGGNMIFPGMRDRMEKQVRKLAGKYGNGSGNYSNVKVHALKQPKYATYIGACCYLKYNADQLIWVSQQQYQQKHNPSPK